ncbi:SDR family NAD(P)-dependent oxidoreductase [Streptomyces geranii]|uniref:SDR family NAD(P)-dependent oxidoreductase n=1 Tax=Streptomyces geranii TaxID=2058923 RepID=UPI000D03C413|nr:SDR family oxidoreductase [Streptomyces geranii]
MTDNHTHSTGGDNLHGRRVVVTAAGSPLGRATALEFAEEGALVLVTDPDRDAVRQVVKTIEYGGGTALAIVGDLGDRQVAEQVVDTALEALGGIDVLVHDAGGMDPLTLAALPHLLADGGGSVVLATAENHAVSRHRLADLVEKLAAMYGDQGLRANAIITGPVTGPATGPATDDTTPEDQAAAIVHLASAAARDLNGTVLSTISYLRSIA